MLFKNVFILLLLAWFFLYGLIFNWVCFLLVFFPPLNASVLADLYMQLFFFALMCCLNVYTCNSV